MESLAAADKDLSARPEQTPFVRNLLWMIWSGAVSIANSIILWIFIARMRDVEELGRFTIVMGLYALFYSICSMGLIPFFVNEISRRKESSDNNDSSPEAEGPVTNFIGSAAVFLSCSSFICAALMTACGFLVSQSWSVRISTLVLSIAMIPTGIINLGESVAISYGKTRLIAFVSTLENILRTLIPFALIWLEFDIAVICASFVAVRLVAVIPYLWTAFRNFSSFAFDRTDFSKILKAAPTFGGTIILASINWQAPIILLGFLSTEAESAKFGVASRFLIPVSILMASYASVLQPIITGYVQKSTANAGAYLTKMVSYPVVISTLAAVLSPFLSEEVLAAFFGVTYADASLTLNILAISVVPFCVVMIVSRGLVATDSQHIDLLANAFGVAICLALGAILIVGHGAVGAATAQLASFLAMAFVEIIYVSRKIINVRVLQKICVACFFILLTYMFLWKL